MVVAGERRSGRSTLLRAIHDDAMRSRDDTLLVDDVEGPGGAAAAVELAMSRVVLASVVAHDAPAACASLVDLGADPGLLARVLTCIATPRLAHKLCAACVRRYAPDAEERRLLGVASLPTGAGFARGVGCARCGGTGRAGRVPVVAIVQRAPRATSWSLEESALAKLLAGVLSTEETLAVIAGER